MLFGKREPKEEKCCCVTGHREIQPDKVRYVEQELRREIREAIREGYTRFYSGFAQGVDLIFAQIVAEEKFLHPKVTLEAAIPYAGRLKTRDPLFQRLIKVCGNVTVACEQYNPSCYLQRNRYMVDHSQRVIAVHDGRMQGGTWYTMEYARRMDREVHVIRV